MTSVRGHARKILVLLCAIAAALLVVAPAGLAHTPSIDWRACEDAEGFECATVEVPRSYSRPSGPKVDLAVVRLPAQDEDARIGSLFVNFGGPGGDAVATIKAIGAEGFASLNDRFDIVGFDPRGTGESEDAIDCNVKPGDATASIASRSPLQRTWTCARGSTSTAATCSAAWQLNDWRDLAHATTGNAARDMNFLRAAVGDRKLTYLGYSYGTAIGATYASLFPNRHRALALDGAFDVDKYLNKPLLSLREQSGGFEKGLNRFFQACAANQDACLHFGGDDPWIAFDELVDKLSADPQPASADGSTPRGWRRRLGGRVGRRLRQAVLAVPGSRAGRRAGGRLLADPPGGRRLLLPAGRTAHTNPFIDRYFALGALEQRYTRDVFTYIEAGEHSWNLFDHFWLNSGYVELPWGLFPIKPKGAYYGPFEVRQSAPTTLVVGTTYDPASPYRGARGLVADLGNARLLTMRGDGHTAYPGNSPCIDEAVEAYLEEGILPAKGTVCRQQVPFEAPALQALRRSDAERPLVRPHVKPLVGAVR